MSPPTGQALALKLQLAKLKAHYAVVDDLFIIPPVTLEHPDHDIIVEGYAATSDLDLAHTKFRPWAFDNIGTHVKQHPKLLYRHDPSQPAGEIQQLYYDNSGNVRIKALVTHPEAKRAGGFSIGGSVHSYELREVDSPANFHAYILRASIEEISITDRPCNIHALIQTRQRHQTSAIGHLYALAAAKTAALARFTQLINKGATS